MSTSTSYLCFGCIEIANNARTLAYHKWACATGRYEAACIPRLSWLCECPADGLRSDYVDPATDGVCWYDPLVPESMDFLGIIITKATGIRTSTFTREVSDAISGGSILQRPLVRGKQIVFEAILLATSCAGMDYGIEWMRRQLEDDSGCPKDQDCTSCEGRQMAVRVHCSATALDKGLHTFTSAGTIDGFSIVEDDFPMGRKCCCAMRRFTFTIQTEDAASHSAIAAEKCTVTSCGAFSYITDCKNTEPDECCPFCTDGACDYCTTDPGCDCFAPFVLKPTSLATTAPCFCDPVCRCIVACELTSVQSGYANSIRLTLFSGADVSDPEFMRHGMRNVVIRLWENPRLIAKPTSANGYDVLRKNVKPCAEVGVSWVPPATELVIDGVSGRSWLKCNGRCIDHSSRVFSISGSVFPLVTRCVPVIATVEWDCLNYQENCAPGASPSSMTLESFLRFKL